MPITLPSPISVPAIAEKSADLVWIQSIMIHAENPAQPVRANIKVAPFVSGTGEILADSAQHISIPDVFTACQSNATLANALQGIYSAVEVLCREKFLFGLTPETTAPTITLDLPSTWTVQTGGASDGAFTCNIDATGYPLNIQWRKNGVAVDGATGKMYSGYLPPEEQSAVIDVVISNEAGTATSTACTVSRS